MDHHQSNNPLVHLADLPNLDYDPSALYQPVPQLQPGDDLGQNEHDHAGITTLAEFADMAGSIDQRSRLTEMNMDLDSRGLMGRSFGDEGMGLAGPSGLKRTRDGSSLQMDDVNETAQVDHEDNTTVPPHLSTTRMVLMPAHFPTYPYTEEIEESQIPDYLQARAREFVFLKHAEKKNDLKKSKKEIEEENENAQELHNHSQYTAEALNSAFHAEMNGYPYDPYTQAQASSHIHSQHGRLDQPDLNQEGPIDRPPAKRKFGGPLQYAWISEYRCCFSGKHRERDHVSKSGRTRKRAPSTKVGCKAKFMLRKVIKSGLIEATYQWEHTGHDPADPTELDRARKKKNNPDLRGIVWGTPVPRSQAEIEADLAAFEGKDVKRRKTGGVRGKGKGKGKQQADHPEQDVTGFPGGQVDTYEAMQRAGGSDEANNEKADLDALDRALQFNPNNARFEISQSRSSHPHPHHGVGTGPQQGQVQAQPDFYGIEARYEATGAEGYGHAQGGFSRTNQQTSDLRTTGSRQEMEQRQQGQGQLSQPQSQSQNILEMDSQMDPDLLAQENEAIVATAMEHMSSLPLPLPTDASTSNGSDPTGLPRRPEVLLAEFQRSYQDMGKLLETAQRALVDVRRSGRQEETEASTMEDMWKRYDETLAEYKRLQSDMQQGGLLPPDPDQ